MSSAYISIKEQNEEKNYDTFDREKKKGNFKYKIKSKIKILLILSFIIIIYILINNYYINPTIKNCKKNFKKIKKNDTCYKKTEEICNDNWCSEIDSCPLDCERARLLLSMIILIADVGFTFIIYGISDMIIKIIKN
jgi:hypothetical protein